MARVTRLELATFGVTGRRSNQLSYTPAFVLMLVDFADDKGKHKVGKRMVGDDGVEPPTYSV